MSLGKLYNYSRLSLVQGTSKRISTSLSKIDYSLPSWQTISVVASHNLCEQLQATIWYRKNHLRKEETSVHFLPFYSLLYNHETIGKYIHKVTIRSIISKWTWLLATKIYLRKKWLVHKKLLLCALAKSSLEKSRSMVSNCETLHTSLTPTWSPANSKFWAIVLSYWYYYSFPSFVHSIACVQHGIKCIF